MGLGEERLDLDDQVEEAVEVVEVERDALLLGAEVVDGELADGALDGFLQARRAVDAVVGHRGAEGPEDVEGDGAERGLELCAGGEGVLRRASSSARSSAGRRSSGISSAMRRPQDSTDWRTMSLSPSWKGA